MFDVACPFIYAAVIGVVLGLILRIYKQSGSKHFIEVLIISMATIPVMYLTMVLSICPLLYFAIGKKQRIICLAEQQVYEGKQTDQIKLSREEFRKVLNDHWYKLCLLLLGEVAFNIDTITCIVIDATVMMIEPIPEHSIRKMLKTGADYLMAKLYHLLVDPFISNKLVYKKV